MAIVNEMGEFLNPPGSLTGIPLEKLIELGLYKACLLYTSRCV